MRMNGSKTSIGKRLAQMASANAFRWFLFVLFIVLFSWPYISFIDAAMPDVSFRYFFMVWALLIVALILLSIADAYAEDIKDNG